jgi:hypothetical protein
VTADVIENLDIKIAFKTIILSVVLYGCETYLSTQGKVREGKDI